MSKYIHKNKKQSGFTLIELLVVIAIIGLISAIVLFATQDVRQHASNLTFVRNLRQFRTWQELYLSENGSYIPNDCAVGTNCQICSNPNNPSHNWPPASLVGPDYFSNGLPYIKLGCMVYILNGVNVPAYPDYELHFYIYYNGDAKLAEVNAQLSSTFNTPPDPCVWYDIEVASCFVFANYKD
ncbi:MAG TPA: type II secretion system protein [Candidatus Binatia bacterium]|nr:type II secretion system protein [Candidatus Binatia bacterium]